MEICYDESMLTYFKDPRYELALSAGVLYSYATYIAHIYNCSNLLTYHTFSLALSSIWFHTMRDDISFWADQIVLNSWVLMFLYEAYLRHWIAVGLVVVCILYSVLIFYVGQMYNIYSYSPIRFWSIFYHMSVHLFSSIFAIIIITMFPVPK